MISAIAGEPSSSDGLCGSGPAGSTERFGTSGERLDQQLDAGARRVSAVVSPPAGSRPKWRVKVGRRRSSSTRTTRRPVSAIVCARSTATVVLPSPGDRARHEQRVHLRA